MSEIRYDVFISAKSEDYPRATAVVKFLTDAGLHVFFSQQELGQLGNSDYYSAIDDALEVSRHMLVVTSSRENVTSPWVRKEWQTFLNEKLSGRKTGNVVTLLCGGMVIGDLPLSLRQHEARLEGDLPSLLNYFKPPAAPKTAAPPQATPQTQPVAVPPATPHTVYICYSRDDQAAADAICAALERQQLRCWIASRDLPPGAIWSDAVVQAIRSSRVVVLVFSAHANASPRVKNQVACAADSSLKLLPVRIENVPPERDLTYYLGDAPWFDATTPPLERHLDQLVPALRALVDNPSARSGSRQNSPPLPLVPPPPPSKKSLLKSPRFIVLLVAACIIAILIFLIVLGATVGSKTDSQLPPAPSVK